MYLYLVRHADADPSVTTTDFDRPLTAFGEEQAEWLGKYINSQRYQLDLIIPSSAKRTLTTALTLAKNAELPSSYIVTDPQIYQADLAQLLAVVQKIEHVYHNVMLVGHNPGISTLNAYLLGLDVVNLVIMPNAALSVLDVDIDRWDEIDAGLAKQVDFVSPT